VRYARYVARRFDRDATSGTLLKRVARLHLVVLGGEAPATHSLPDAGSRVIGRGDDCEIRLDDTSISRRHARITLGAELTIEDLGSSNATTVRGARLVPGVPAKIALDEVITLGAIGLAIQQHAPASPHRTLWGHDYFEARLDDECARARRAGTTFALLRVGADAGTVDALSDAVGDADVIGTHAPGQWEILVIDASAEDAAQVAAAICGAVATARVAIAMFPGDGGDAPALASTANARLASGQLAAPPVAPRAEGSRRSRRETERDIAYVPEDRVARPAAPRVAPGAAGEQASASEREAIEQALARASGDQTKAARLLGVSRRMLANKLNLHGLALPRKRG